MPIDTPNVIETFDNPNSANTAVTPSAADSFQQTLIARGVAPADAKARADKYRPTQPDPLAPPVTPARRPTEAQVNDLSPEKLPNLTAGQLDGAKAHLIGHREKLVVRAADMTVTPADRARATASLERVDATLKGMGHDPANPPVDERTTGERDFDNAGLSAAVDPAAYDLPGIFNRPDLTAAELPELNATIRSSMAELNVPTALGKVVAEAILDGAEKWGALPNDKAREDHYAANRRTVAAVLHLPYEKVIADLKPVIAKLSEANRAWLANSGALESPNTLISLYRAQRIVAGRAKLGGGNA
jgi:hypothetical protein